MLGVPDFDCPFRAGPDGIKRSRRLSGLKKPWDSPPRPRKSLIKRHARARRLGQSPVFSQTREPAVKIANNLGCWAKRWPSRSLNRTLSGAALFTHVLPRATAFGQGQGQRPGPSFGPDLRPFS